MSKHIQLVPQIDRIQYLTEARHIQGVMMRWADVTFSYKQGGTDRTITVGMNLPLHGEIHEVAYATLRDVSSELSQETSSRMEFDGQFKKDATVTQNEDGSSLDIYQVFACKIIYAGLAALHELNPRKRNGYRVDYNIDPAVMMALNSTISEKLHIIPEIITTKMSTDHRRYALHQELIGFIGELGKLDIPYDTCPEWRNLIDDVKAGIKKTRT